jgi:hypothetical protein
MIMVIIIIFIIFGISNSGRISSSNSLSSRMIV